MRQTAFDQPILKQLSGNRIDGSPTDKTVMTVSLAWSPEETPTREDMIAAGQSFLKHMKWEEHQVLFVAHNDTKHPHVHLIINRLHPQTGMTQDHAWFKNRAQSWALAYEREHGRIFCEAREARYGRDENAHADRMNYAEWRAWAQISKDNAIDPEVRDLMETGERNVLLQGQRHERIGFWKETGRMRLELRKKVREVVREELSDDWKQYKLARDKRLAQAHEHDNEARRASRNDRKPSRTQGGPIKLVKGRDGKFHRERLGEAEAVKRVKEAQKAYHAAMRGELWQMRADITTRQIERIEALVKPALERLSADRAKAYELVKAQHRDERTNLREDQQTGTRRRDVLGGLNPEQPRAPSVLSPLQAKAYVENSRTANARQTEFDAARKQTTETERLRGDQQARDPRSERPARERTDRNQEAKDKDQVREAKYKSEVDWILAKRKADRERDRGGGRDR